MHSKYFFGNKTTKTFSQSKVHKPVVFMNDRVLKTKFTLVKHLMHSGNEKDTSAWRSGEHLDKAKSLKQGWHPQACNFYTGKKNIDFRKRFQISLFPFFYCQIFFRKISSLKCWQVIVCIQSFWLLAILFGFYRT